MFNRRALSRLRHSIGVYPIVREEGNVVKAVVLNCTGHQRPAHVRNKIRINVGVHAVGTGGASP